MDDKALKNLLRIIREVRSMTDAVLGKQELSGELVEVAGRGGSIKTWLHRASSADRPVIVELHGGGFALGDARKTDALRTWMAQSYDATVIGVDYRLAPEHPFPAAIEDVQDALSYYAAHADQYGINTNEVYLTGYSAGANLSLAVCLDDAVDTAYHVAGCVLHYPMLDAAMDPLQVEVRKIDLSPEIMEAFNAWYLNGTDPHEPRVSVVFASDDQLQQLPKVALYPVRGDALADGAVTLEERLRKLGKSCELHFVEDVYHGYIEDEANREAYGALTFPEEIERRPKGTAAVAEEVVREGLTLMLGEPCRHMTFPGQVDAGGCSR